MRSRFALACAALVLSVPSAGAFDRRILKPGDSVLGDIRVAGTLDEMNFVLARGSVLTIGIAKAGGAYQPAMGLYSADYGALSVAPAGPTSLRSAPLESAEYRVLVGSQHGTVGSYRFTSSVKPQTKFGLAATAEAPADTLTFGAYPDFEATVAIKWKGPSPVTLASVTGPDGAEIVSSELPRTTANSFALGGFRATAVGDHVVKLAVPQGTQKWSLTVTLSGRLPRGTSYDDRRDDTAEPVTVNFPSPGYRPVATVAGEFGGPNECLLSASLGQPDGAFLDGGGGAGGCSRFAREQGASPTKYLLYCTNGFFAEVTGVERYDSGPWAGWVKSFDAPSLRSPQGSGSASYSGFTYDAAGRPTGWTEVRRFDASGRAHELVYSGAEYFTGGGFCRAFRVTERLLPDGVPRTYDYAPLR